MRVAIVLFLTILGLSVLPAGAACPADGIYSTSDVLLPGRASESQPTGQAGEFGNAVLAESWDGVQLGSQWQLACPAICVDPMLIADTIDGQGNGNRVYFTQYCGGVLWLDGGDQPWSLGDVEYLVDVLACDFTTTIDFLGGQPVMRSTDIDIAGHFRDCPESCVEFTVAAACQLGEDYGYNFPAGFPPPVWAETCLIDRQIQGTWWDVCCITMMIQGCDTPSENSSWSRVKGGY